MFHDDQLMGLMLERIEAEASQSGTTCSRHDADSRDSESKDDIRTFALMEFEGHHDDLAEMGLVKTSRTCSDRAFPGLL